MIVNVMHYQPQIVKLCPCTTDKLTGGFGKRKQEARFRRYNKDADPSNWYRTKLMLYYPWYDEQTNLLGGYTTNEEHYKQVHATMQANESNIAN